MLQTKIKKKINNIIYYNFNLKYLKKIFFKNIFLNSINKNNKLTVLQKFIFNLLKIKKYNIRKRKLCLVTGVYKSNITKILFKRHIFKKFLTINLLPGFKKK